MLKTFAQAVEPIYEALSSARTKLLVDIRSVCHPSNINPTLEIIHRVINADVAFQRRPIDLRNQRTYAVKSGVNGLLDVARQTFKEATEDVHQHVSEINEQFDIQTETRFDNARKYYLRINESTLEGRAIPEILINRYRKKGYIECQTLDLVKLNQRIEDSHQEVILMSDKTVEQLIEDVRPETPALFRVSDSVAMLDMLASFAQLVTTGDYVRPEVTRCLAIKAGRHPVHEKAHAEVYVPNDVYADKQKRFQIITGCNMSGKSTYIRSIALMAVMAQVGSFVPAQYASFPLVDQLFARVSMDDCIEANVSTFASEMRETAFILRNIGENSLAIIDELGRGTSTRDGLAIALSIAEALVGSGAFVWFTTHFGDLAQILNERPGVVNMHLETKVSPTSLQMLYTLSPGPCKETAYGLSLARVVNLPPMVLEVAEAVSQRITETKERKKKGGKALALMRRRKLVLGLREMLLQANESGMEGEVLRGYLVKLQGEFVRRMDGIMREVDGDGGSSDDDGEEKREEKREEGTAEEETDEEETDEEGGMKVMREEAESARPKETMRRGFERGDVVEIPDDVSESEAE